MVHIDLGGPDGNAFVLVGYARKFAKQLGYDKNTIQEMVDRMLSSDYNNVISVFEEHFKDYVVLDRSDEDD